jgi:hypothetical protein
MFSTHTHVGIYGCIKEQGYELIIFMCIKIKRIAYPHFSIIHNITVPQIFHGTQNLCKDFVTPLLRIHVTR